MRIAMVVKFHAHFFGDQQFQQHGQSTQASAAIDRIEHAVGAGNRLFAQVEKRAGDEFVVKMHLQLSALGGILVGCFRVNKGGKGGRLFFVKSFLVECKKSLAFRIKPGRGAQHTQVFIASEGLALTFRKLKLLQSYPEWNGAAKFAVPGGIIVPDKTPPQESPAPGKNTIQAGRIQLDHFGTFVNDIFKDGGGAHEGTNFGNYLVPLAGITWFLKNLNTYGTLVFLNHKRHKRAHKIESGNLCVLLCLLWLK